MKRAAISVLVAVVLAGLGGVGLYKYGGLRRVPEPPSRPSALAAAPPPSASAEPAALPDDPFSTFSSDGGAPPAGSSNLPKDAPRQVRFGVILFQYQGAESAPSNAPSKAAALERAKSLLPEATQNFDEAVKKGDRGSTPNAGAIPQGVLEPTAEFALFTLKKGEVSPTPVDTPRGYWILRRIE